MDKHGMPPRIATVHEMANLLLSKRADATTPPTVGQHWVRNFVNRSPELRSKYNRKYDYQRAKCEDPAQLRAWFQRVQDTIKEYGIALSDQYNFDETGFQMGVISTAKVVTTSDRLGRPRTTQPGNREWVTVIETICAAGFAIPPLIIFEGVMHQASWYEDGSLPQGWSIGVSPNGWTNNEIGLHWLKEVFDKYTKARTIGKYRLLILDGHGSHVTPAFDLYCRENGIIVLCMPAHSSHLLQPLDVGCFSALKRSYGYHVEQLMRLHINHIDKQEFLLLYQQSRAEALNEKNILSGFAATGLAPYNPDRVLCHLHVQIRTPTPPYHPPGGPWVAETPHNIVEVQCQTELIKQYLRHRAHTPPSPTERAFNQLVKACELSMNSAAIYANENAKLRLELERQRKKRGKKRRYIARGGILSSAEAMSLIKPSEDAAERRESIEQTRNAVNDDVQAVESIAQSQGAFEEEVVPVEPAIKEPRRRAPSKCSLCGSMEHNARKCHKK